MPTSYADDAFNTSRACFEQVCSFMGGEVLSATLVEHQRAVWRRRR